MSRTFRYIPFNCRSVSQYEKTWIGLGLYYDPRDPRNRLENGYDGVSQSYYYTSYPGKGWKENYQYTSRRWHKREYHKVRRMCDKRDIVEILREENDG